MVRLTSEEFGDWVARFYRSRNLDLTWERVRVDASLNRVTFAVQRRKNSVDPDIVCRVARTHGRNPLTELAGIPRFSGPLGTMSRPTALEVAAALNPSFALMTLAARVGEMSDAPHPSLRCSLDHYQYRFATWVDIAGNKGSRELMQELLVADSAKISRRLRGVGKFPLDEIIEVVPRLGLSASWGCVLGGYVTLDEAGLGVQFVTDAVAGLSDAELIKVVSGQARYAEHLLDDLKTADDAEGFLG